ncbi:MAG: hypothetical protein AAGN82_23745 [Myxococcota bacterium]
MSGVRGVWRCGAWREAKRARWVALAASMMFLGCQDPTQVTVQVSTKDIGCGDGPAEVNSTVFRAGSTADELAAEGERWSSLVPTLACQPQLPGGARIGDMAYVPSGADDARFSVEVFLGLNGKSAEACAEACGEDCIRASRRLGFVPQQQLLVRIEMDSRCSGICCQEGETCEDGECVSDAACGEGDCGDGGAGAGGEGGDGGGGGGSGVVSTLQRDLVDVLPVGNTDAVPWLVGHVVDTADPTSTQEAFVAPWSDAGASVDDAKVIRCATSGGEVRFIAATTASGVLFTVGTWTGAGDLTCGGANALSPLTDTDINAFIVEVAPQRAETKLWALAGWRQGSRMTPTLEIDDVAITGTKQVIVVGRKSIGFLTLPTGAMPPSGLAGTVLLGQRVGSAGGGVPAVETLLLSGGDQPQIDDTAVVTVDGRAHVAVLAPSHSPNTLTPDRVTLQASQDFFLQQAEVAEVSFLGDISALRLGRVDALGKVLVGFEYEGVITQGPTTQVLGGGSGMSCGVLAVQGLMAPSTGNLDINTFRLNSCDEVFVGRSAHGAEFQHMVAVRSGGSWALSWPSVDKQGPSLTLPGSLSPVSLFQRTPANQVFVGGNTMNYVTAGDLLPSPFAPCDGDRVHPWAKAESNQPLLSCVAAPSN